jgi:lipoprotein signal peptidase
VGLMLATLMLVFAVDRCTKAWAFRRPVVRQNRSIAGMLTILPVRNARPRCWPAGTAIHWCSSFGLALAAALLLVGIDPHANAWLAVGLGAALGGALGNLYDRIRHGAILDFLHVGIGGVFNSADVSVVLGLLVAIASRFEVATFFLGKG